jgi:FKBP-type peptidyl-prolyl cis-trans isomerase
MNKPGLTIGILAALFAGFWIIGKFGPTNAPPPAEKSAAAPTPPDSKTAPSIPEIKVTLGSKAVTTSSGLRYEDTVVGSGPEAANGKTVSVHYTGTLANGTKFDSSKDRNEPFELNLPGQVITGWNEGIPGMKVGGKRKLVIPSALGYGDQGRPPTIPGGATLVFEIELLSVK